MIIELTGVNVLDLNDLELEKYKYSNIESKLSAIRTKNATDETIQREILACNKIIEYSLYLKDALEIIFSKTYIETEKTLNEVNSLIYSLYYRNCCYLISSYESCLSGFVNTTLLSLRSISETTEMIYYLHIKRNDKEAELFLKKELNELNTEETQIVKSRLNHFNPSVIRKLLYEKDKIEQIRKGYENLSRIAHPSIKSVFASYIEDLKVIHDALIGIIFFGISNIIATWEVYHNILNQNKIVKYNFALEEIIKIFGTPSYDIIPDNPKIVNKLNIRNYGSC
ncbi:hypothetical protein [Methanosarcina mazei]|uniref:Uncharacterized protein n=1 Tax=Methanosarcina mazei TaxID=2209 RepID=A0A6C0VK66_METMZ|nr:hypothetical protein [Methanosarcina mazei]QIB91004.1 hypothetical protein FQU78_07995 [Methanosarcina mazei]